MDGRSRNISGVVDGRIDRSRPSLGSGNSKTASIQLISVDRWICFESLRSDTSSRLTNFRNTRPFVAAQVWISYAQFEAKAEMETARAVFRRGYDHIRRQGLKEER